MSMTTTAGAVTERSREEVMEGTALLDVLDREVRERSARVRGTWLARSEFV